MPVSLQQIRSQIARMGPEAVQRQKALDLRRKTAEALFFQHANNLEELEQRVELASQNNPELRCARPAGEALDCACPLPDLDTPVAILAADGSQINPDRHEQVEFGVVNTGAVIQRPGAALQEVVESQLLLGDALQTQAGRMTEEYVALLRDVSERKLLAELAEKEALPVVTLTDGQLELFRQPQKSAEYDQKFEEFLDALRRLAYLQAVTAGYVDRPQGDLLVRLLELISVPENEIDQVVKKRPLRGVMDRDLFGMVLQGGQRGARLKIHSGSSERFPGELALHYFYLNAGSGARSNLARVEIPAWVAGRPLLINRLHAVLIAQSGVLGSHPYPYLLQRAHEVALVRMDEKQQISGMIVQEMIHLNLEFGQKTNKQFQKDQLGKRKRYK